MSPNRHRESALELAARLGHERLIVVHDAATGLRAAIALHSSVLGPSVGGTRMRAYARFDDAVVDALRLSRAMTSKAAFAGLAFGGAKAVIDADPRRSDRRELLAAFARAVIELEGRFVTGGDMGIDQDDVTFMATISKAFAHAPQGSGPDASDLTAIGTLAAIEATAARIGVALDRLHVALQGVGEVGGRLARRLAERGVRLTIADVASDRTAQLAHETGAAVVAPDAILAVDCDLFSPNAAGEVIDAESIERLRCRAICGAANNPIASEELGDELERRGIVVAPDFVANAGGVLSLLYETGALDLEGTVRRVERIGADLAAVYERARAEKIAPFRVAERIVVERLAAARSAR